MIVRISKQMVPARKHQRVSRDIKAGSYLKAIESDRLQSVSQLIRKNKGVML
jgi:hypothetical protein